jgi:hypothetical protein
MQPLPPAAEPSVNDWIVYSDARKPFIGVVTSCEKRTVHVHAFEYSAKLRRYTAAWLDPRLRTRLSDDSKPKWTAANYVVDRENIILGVAKMSLFGDFKNRKIVQKHIEMQNVI